MADQCAFAGCNRRLSGDNTTGVCNMHQHAPGCCVCARGRARDAAPKPAARPGVRSQVVRAVPGADHRSPSSIVSVVRLPWDADVMPPDPRDETHPRVKTIRSADLDETRGPMAPMKAARLARHWAQVPEHVVEREVR